MRGVECFSWMDLLVNEIGFALTKVDETIKKSINRLTEFTEELFDEQPKQDSAREPNNGKSGEQHSSFLDKPVADKVKESPAMKEEPIQHWSMTLTKIPECLIREQGNDQDYHAPGDDYEEEEESHETRVSESFENMSELELGASAKNISPSCYDHHNEECSTGSSLKCRSEYELLKGVESCEDADEVEECNSKSAKEVMESLLKDNRMLDVSNESLVVHDHEDDVSNELEGFVDLEFCEAKTISPECDWVFVTNDY